MDDSGEVRIPECHVTELADFYAAHDRWLFGHACVRTRGDRELAADLVQDTFEAAARAWDMLRGHPDRRQRAWLLSTLAHKDISDFRHQEAFRRRQPDIHARYQPTAADTEAEALNAIALARAREIIEDFYPRLGAWLAEEAELATRIAAGRHAREELTEGGDALDGRARANLERVAQDGGQAGVSLQEANLRLVVSLAERYTGRGVPLADLVESGMVGLARALQKYDHAKGYRFGTFATWWVRQAIIQAVTAQAVTAQAVIEARRLIPAPEPGAGISDELTVTERLLLDELGREPTAEELAAELDLAPGRGL